MVIKQATYQDIIDLLEYIVGEIINGILETHPRSAPKLALAADSLGDELIPPFQKGRSGPSGWGILPEPECHLDSHVLVPDLAGWLRHRMPALPETVWFDVVPDRICEILSPATARLNRIVKMSVHAQLGVAHLWLFDTILQACQLHDSHWLSLGTFANDQAVSVAPFAEHTISLSDL